MIKQDTAGKLEELIHAEWQDGGMTGAFWDEMLRVRAEHAVGVARQ